MPDRRRPELFLGYLQGAEAPDEKRQRLFLSDDDCKTGLHVIGAPNTGKSKFLEHLIRQEIRRGHGLCLIDPHAELYNDILEWCAYVRPLQRVLPLNLSAGEHILGFNPFVADEGGDLAVQATRNFLAAIKAWGDADSDQMPRLERVCPHIFHAILEATDLTLCEADHFVTFDAKEMRRYLVERVKEPTVRRRLRDALLQPGNFNDFMGQVESTLNRLNRFTSKRVTRRFLGLSEPERNLDFSRIMDEGAILLVNIRRSPNLTEDNMRLLGSFLVSSFIEHGFRRDPKTARPFTLYLDEFYNFVPPDLGQALPQLRKFNTRFVLAHQLLSQLRKEDAHILDEVLGCIKARVVFGGLHYGDALTLAPEMFAGQTDYTEVKYWHETVKHWPVYDRDTVRGRGRAKTKTKSKSHTHMEGLSEMESHTDAIGDASQWANSRSNHGSTGISVPYLDGFPAADGSTRFDSTGWGMVETNGGATSSVSANTAGKARTVADADTQGEGEADTGTEQQIDVPIYRPIARIEKKPEFFGLDEQRDRQAALLMLQLQRHAFVRSPGGTTRPILVPFVKRYPLDPEIVAQYERDMNERAGAMPPNEVDRILEQRAGHLEQQAKVYAREQDAVKFDVDARQDTAILPPRKPQRPKKQSARVGPTGRTRRRLD